MKVCIVTAYNNMNSGSHWQAYALGQILKMQGHEVYYYKREKRGTATSFAIQLNNIVRKLIHLRFLETRDYIKRIISFKKTEKDFSIIDSSSLIYDKIDCFILGSDTIWNLDSPYYNDNKDVYWGDIFRNKKVISYAGSIANTKQKLLEDDFYTNSINNWQSISVRDVYSRNTLSKLTNKPITIVCDPTLLLQENYYKKLYEPKNGNYIFLYLFKKLTCNQDLQLRTFANNNKLEIVCGTRRDIFSHADRYIINNPYNFMAYMLGAQYVVTDTYHGTIFSTNFNKQFVVINRDLMKIQDFLSIVGLADRIIDCESELHNIINQTIDYNCINQKLRRIRCESLEYLINSILRSE